MKIACTAIWTTLHEKICLIRNKNCDNTLPTLHRVDVLDIKYINQIVSPTTASAIDQT